jgi:thymidylate synthase/dihydrofolate reductase
MYEIITACTKNYGIGKDNDLPWHCPEELRLFRDKTRDSVVVCGRKTTDNLPSLPNRIIYTVSKSNGSLELQLHRLRTTYPHKNIFIAGGGEIYDYTFRKLPHLVSKLHISIMKEDVACDTYITEFKKGEWVVLEEYDYPNFTHYVLKYDPREAQYTDLIRSIPRNFRQTRNSETASVFGKTLKFDLSDCSFPLLTTKKMFFRGIVEELLFFIRGQTDSTLLESRGVNIWRPNTTREFLDSHGFPNRKEGLMGPMYGFQWRFYNSQYNEETGENVTPRLSAGQPRLSAGQPRLSAGQPRPSSPHIDQLQNVIDLIRTDPTSRRIILTSFNPIQASEGVLYPCHSLIVQFYVSDTGHLDMFCYNRSQDLFLGTPFNIASSALLLMLIAKVTDKKVGTLHMSLGDVHLYKNHYDTALIQTERSPYPFPKITFRDVKTLQDIEGMSYGDFTLERYQSHPALKAEMVA